MRIDLRHNKILEQTMSASFEASVMEDLCPKLQAIFGENMLGIQMYEDYLTDNFIKDNFRYYPLTVITSGSNITCWIKWNTSDEASFDGGNPYAFLGERLEFELVEEVPIAFANALNGRARYFEEGLVKLNVSFGGKDVMMLSGKYSQTFVDEMARQLTAVIERTMGISGLASSTIELDLFFAPDTYMEHTSENVTYRRLLMSAKGCAPRDFWVKWTRKNSAVAYSVNDNVTADDITFEVGENVSQKIREKEYRFLVYMNSDKYRNAMGRKNITEWRELIKRAVKKGELIKGVAESEVEDHASEVSDKLAEILQKCGVAVPVVEAAAAPADAADEVSEALRNAVLAESAQTVSEIENDAVAPVADAADEGAEFEFELDREYPQVQFDINATSEGAESFVFTEEDPALIEIEKQFTASNAAEPAADVVADAADEASVVAEAEAPASKDNVSITVSEEEIVGAEDDLGNDDLLALMVEIERLEAKLRLAEEKCVALEEAKTLADGRLDAAISANAEVSARAEKLEADLGEANSRLSALEAQKNAAEESLAAANRDLIAANNENARLLNDIAVLREHLDAAVEENKKAEERYRAQLELEEKERVRDKLLFAEAARKAKEESERLAKEKAEAEARAVAERAALEAERLAEEERRREEEARRLEAERIEAELANAAQRKENALARAKEIRRRMEEEARRSADAKYGAVISATEPKDEAVADNDTAAEVAEPITDPAVTVGESTVVEISKNTVEEQESALTFTEPAIDFTVDEVNLEPETAEEAPVAESAPQEIAEEPANESEVEEAPVAEPVVKQPEVKQPPKYTYTSKIVRMLFRNPVDDTITARLRDLIATAIKIARKERVYIKMKASVPDNTTVILDILQIPEEEMQLLIDIIHHLGNSNLGIYKVILE